MRAAPSPRAASGLAIATALAVVYVVWGSTYLAIHVAVGTIPPLLLAGARFAAAGALLYAFARLRGAPRPGAAAWRTAALVGLVMFVGAHGLLAWASQHVSSGTAALVSAASPAWIALGAAAGLAGGHRPTAVGVVGIALGLAGVAVAMEPATLVRGGAHALALGALAASSLAWAGASLLTRSPRLPGSVLQSAGMSMLAGGAMLLVLSALAREPARLDAAAVAPAAWGALAYLTLVGSVLAYACYVWLLRVDGPARVSAHSFVNPVVALLLGAGLAGEALTRASLASVALVAVGVALVTLAPRRAPAQPPAPPRAAASEEPCATC